MMDAMIVDMRKAVRRSLLHWLFVTAFALWIGCELRANSPVLAAGLFMAAGAALCACYAELRFIGLKHSAKVWAMKMTMYYEGLIKELCAAYGQDDSHAVNEMPAPFLKEES